MIIITTATTTAAAATTTKKIVLIHWYPINNEWFSDRESNFHMLLPSSRVIALQSICNYQGPSW